MLRRCEYCLRWIALATLAEFAVAAPASAATGDKYAVATVHPIATDAAMDVLREGGNAVDAAVAAALALSVVDNFNSGIGGGCLILIREPGGDILAIDGRETAPAAATRDMYVRDGVADTSLSQTGPLAVGTPGALAAYAMAIDLCGETPLARLLAPGERAAAEGFAISPQYARNIRRTAGALRSFAGPDDPRFGADGDPLDEGDTLVQADLARTYRQIAENGVEWFYEGEFARRTEEWMKANGGVLSADDFRAYRAKRREPIRSSYRGHTVVGFPPPSSGGVHVAQILSLMAPYDLKAISRRDRPTAIHLIAEAMKLAFADRAYWLGDSDFAQVPRGLLSEAYLAKRAKLINPQRATPVETHGTPNTWRQDLFGRHTTHIAAADAQGYWVAITATVNTTFGSKVVIPGTGVVMNNEMDDFSVQPGVPNAFGLVGAENNAVEPGKRPLSSMSPTIVLGEQGRPVLTVGAAGGPKIITQVTLAILRNIGMGQSVTDAVAGVRFHHQWRPDVLMVEEGMPPDIVAALEAKGHRVDVLSSAGVTQAIAFSERDGFTAVHDPRTPGKASAE